MNISLKNRASQLFQRAVSLPPFRGWWENSLTRWPRVLLYHFVGCPPLDFFPDPTTTEDVFLDQLADLKKRFSFISLPEFFCLKEKKEETSHSILLTFDDGFRSTYLAAIRAFSELGIPSVFFLNPRTIDNAYLPWHLQYYYLRHRAPSRGLEPLRRSLNISSALSLNDERNLCHRHFSIERVVLPIEEGLREAGFTPEDLAFERNLFVSSADLRHCPHGITLANHSHSHYPLAKLREDELKEDLSASSEALAQFPATNQQAFAYPFGIPNLHFSQDCQKVIESLLGKVSIFSACPGDAPDGQINRRGMDGAARELAWAAAADVRPRTFVNHVICKMSRRSI